jgi:hypothetical protein
VLTSLDPLYALLVIAVLVLPYLIWLLRADALVMPPWPAISDLGARATQWGLAARKPGARDVRHRACWRSSIPLVRPRCRGRADHLPAAGRSAGARFRLFLRYRAGAASAVSWPGLFNFHTSSAAPGVALLMSDLP